MSVSVFNYHEYLASREWALRREAVRQRSENRCERVVNGYRCYGPQDSVHHKTYESIGNEPLEDLMAVCDNCHRWLSGKTSDSKIVKHRLDQLRVCPICGESNQTILEVTGEFTIGVCYHCWQFLVRDNNFTYEKVDALQIFMRIRRMFDRPIRLGANDGYDWRLDRLHDVARFMRPKLPVWWPIALYDHKGCLFVHCSEPPNDEQKQVIQDAWYSVDECYWLYVIGDNEYDKNDLCSEGHCNEHEFVRDVVL